MSPSRRIVVTGLQIAGWTNQAASFVLHINKRECKNWWHAINRLPMKSRQKRYAFVH